MLASRSSLLISILLAIAWSSQCTESLRILAIFPLHGKSHFVMCERLAKGLAEKGHQVDVYSHFPLKRPIPNYTDHSLAGTLPAVMNNVSFDYLQRFKIPDMRVMLDEVGNKICDLMSEPVFRELFNKLKRKQVAYDVVIIETFVSNCYLGWGRFLKIPMIGVMTSALIDWYNEPLGNPHNTAVNPSSWSHFYHPMDFWERLANAFVYHSINLQATYHMSVQNAHIKKYFGSGYPDAGEITRDLDLLLVNTHHSVDGIRAFTPAIVPVAGLHIEDDGSKLPMGVQKFLDESKDGCVYISFGSMVRIETFPKHVLDAFYRTFKKIAPVRVLMKIAKPEELPKGLPSNVMTQSWFSQVKVLKHKNIRAFVTHGGLMSTQESLSAGVPMVGVPLFGDQHINVRSQVRRNVAKMVELSDFDFRSFHSAIREILENPIYKKNAEKVSHDFFDRPMSPMDTAAFWIEYIARHGKQALRSPVVDMPWYQAHLIDVYGFVLVVIVAACYVIKLVVKSILNLCYAARSSPDKRKRE